MSRHFEKKVKSNSHWSVTITSETANLDQSECRKINSHLEIYTKRHCYIANAKTKRDWLIRGHVALDKCNVSPRETSKKLLPGCEYKKNKMAA